MKYPLHTTGDLACLPLYLTDPRRQAVWVHVGSDDERKWALEQVCVAGWEVVPKLPQFFVVGFRPGTPPEDVDRLVSVIQPRQTAADVEFLGRLFGYNPSDVAWYIRQTCTPQ